MITYKKWWGGEGEHTFDLSKVTIQERVHTTYILTEKGSTEEFDDGMKITRIYELASFDRKEDAEELLRVLKLGEAAQKYLETLDEG